MCDVQLQPVDGDLRPNAVHLAALLATTAVSRELIVDADGDPRFGKAEWERLKGHQQQINPVGCGESARRSAE